MKNLLMLSFFRVKSGSKTSELVMSINTITVFSSSL